MLAYKIVVKGCVNPIVHVLISPLTSNRERVACNLQHLLPHKCSSGQYYEQARPSPDAWRNHCVTSPYDSVTSAASTFVPGKKAPSRSTQRWRWMDGWMYRDKGYTLSLRFGEMPGKLLVQCDPSTRPSSGSIAEGHRHNLTKSESSAPAPNLRARFPSLPMT